MQRMTDEKMLAQREQVRALDGRYGKMRLLHGTELNIDPDGEVDWDADFLAGFDVCVASVHSHFTQIATTMTRRLVRACENPYVNIIGHPTDPPDRPARAVSTPTGTRSSPPPRRTGTAMEINSIPGPARPPRRADPAGQATRREVRHQHRRALHRPPGPPALRRRAGPAGWLTSGRRDQHLAAAPPAVLPLPAPPGTEERLMVAPFPSATVWRRHN